MHTSGHSWILKYFCSLYIQCLPLHYQRERIICIFLWQNVCSSKNSSNFTRGSFVRESENVSLVEHETCLWQRSYVISPWILRQVTGKEQILTLRSINYCRKMHCITPGSKGKEEDLQNSCFLGPIFWLDITRCGIRWNSISINRKLRDWMQGYTCSY